jgi:hypothetical protein
MVPIIAQISFTYKVNENRCIHTLGPPPDTGGNGEHRNTLTADGEMHSARMRVMEKEVVA